MLPECRFNLRVLLNSFINNPTSDDDDVSTKNSRSLLFLFLFLDLLFLGIDLSHTLCLPLFLCKEGVQRLQQEEKQSRNTSSNPITGRLQYSCKSLYDRYTPPRRPVIIITHDLTRRCLLLVYRYIHYFFNIILGLCDISIFDRTILTNETRVMRTDFYDGEIKYQLRSF